MLYEALREFTVVEEEGEFIGTGGLHIGKIWRRLGRWLYEKGDRKRNRTAACRKVGCRG